jgi:hypothetical protein
MPIRRSPNGARHPLHRPVHTGPGRHPSPSLPAGAASPPQSLAPNMRKAKLLENTSEGHCGEINRKARTKNPLEIDAAPARKPIPSPDRGQPPPGVAILPSAPAKAWGAGRAI